MLLAALRCELEQSLLSVSRTYPCATPSFTPCLTTHCKLTLTCLLQVSDSPVAEGSVPAVPPGPGPCSWPGCGLARTLAPVPCTRKDAGPACSRPVHHVCSLKFVGHAQEAIDAAVGTETTKWCYPCFKEVRDSSLDLRFLVLLRTCLPFSTSTSQRFAWLTVSSTFLCSTCR